MDEPSIIDESIWILPSKCKTTLKRTVEKKNATSLPRHRIPGPLNACPGHRLVITWSFCWRSSKRWCRSSVEKNHGRCGMSHLEMVGVFWYMSQCHLKNMWDFASADGFPIYRDWWSTLCGVSMTRLKVQGVSSECFAPDSHPHSMSSDAKIPSYYVDIYIYPHQYAPTIQSHHIPLINKWLYVPMMIIIGTTDPIIVMIIYIYIPITLCPNCTLWLFNSLPRKVAYLVRW